MKEKLRTGHKAIKSIDKVFNEFPGERSTIINITVVFNFVGICECAYNIFNEHTNI